MKSKSGFTLLEILLVVGIIAILAGIVIIAINPSKQLATVRNAQRKSDIKAVANAITQFYIDHSYYPASTTFSTTSLMTICPTGASSSPAAGFNCTANNMLNLSELVPTYLVAIPSDPATTTTAGYSVMLVNNQPAISAPLAELGVKVVVGNVPSGCVATGGTISTVAGYKIHTFTSNDTFTVTSGSCNVEVLVVAGGGAGGIDAGGGGGAGGLISTTSYSVSGTINVTVGAGGTGGPAGGSAPTVGGNSSFGSLVALGGGAGAYYCGHNALSGGSGGGGPSCCCAASPAAGTAGQGYGGGTTGGGGGAGGPGVNRDAGNGLYFSQFAAVAGSPAGWFAGGGGAGMSPPGNGGNGGGASGNVNGNPGIANTGGGGGGGYGGGPGAIGGNGGSGIVIVRYAN